MPDYECAGARRRGTTPLTRRVWLQVAAVGGGVGLTPTVARAGAVRQEGPARSPAAHDPDGRYEVDVFDLEYRRAGDEAWLARIYRPQGAGPFPALLDV